MPQPFNLSNYVNLSDALRLCYISVLRSNNVEMEIDRETEAHIQRVSNWLSNDTKKAWGLIICGSYGNGKTTMIKSLQRLLNVAGQPMTIISALDIASIAKDSPSEFENIKKRRILAMDDIGTEAQVVKSYGNTITPVTDVIVNRYNHHLTTLITTNCSIKEMGERYGGYIGDRLREMFDVIQYNNGSFRGMKGGAK